MPNVENLTRRVGSMRHHDTSVGDGAFGFGSSVVLPGDSCFVKKEWGLSDCEKNPINCMGGFSFAIWEKLTYPYDLLKLEAQSQPKQYLATTGVDHDPVNGTSRPGFAIYRQGHELTAVVSTGVNVWKLSVSGQMYNQTWTNIAIRWKHHLNSTADTQGLELLINTVTVGKMLYPIGTKKGSSKFVPVYDFKIGGQAPPVLILGCSWNYDRKAYDNFFKGELDEVIFWKRRLISNSNKDERILFYGGYSEKFENINPEQFSLMLNNVNLENTKEASFAALVLEAILIPHPTENSFYPTPSTSEPPTTASTQKMTSVLSPLHPDQQQASSFSQKNLAESQIYLLKSLSSMLKVFASNIQRSPSEIELRMPLIIVASKILSGRDPNNVAKWKAIYKHDPRHEGPYQTIREIHNYALGYANLIDTTSTERTTYYSPKNRIFNYSASGQDFVISIVKIPSADLSTKVRLGYPNYDSYEWGQNFEKFGRPKDEYSIPTGMFRDRFSCRNKPASIVMSVYNEFRHIGRTRRNPRYIRAEKWEIDSMVFTVDIELNVDPANPDPKTIQYCTISPDYMKWNPLRGKFYHKTQKPAFSFWIRKGSKNKQDIFEDYNSDNIFSSSRSSGIEKRHCARWNYEFEISGAWDTEGCNMVESNYEFSICECSSWGTMAILAELTPEVRDLKVCSLTYKVSEWVGIGLSIFVLGMFIMVALLSLRVWDMFHLIRSQTALSWLLVLVVTVIMDVFTMQDKVNTNIAFGLCLIYSYSCVLVWFICESHATLVAVTTGIINKRSTVYFPFGFGVSLFPVGAAFVFVNESLGSDPLGFITHEPKIKALFFYGGFGLLMISIIFLMITFCNLSASRMKSLKAIPQVRAQTRGLFVLAIGYLSLLGLGYLAHVKRIFSFGKDGLMPVDEWHCILGVYKGWFGIFIFICLGLASPRFVSGVTGEAKKRRSMMSKYDNSQEEILRPNQGKEGEHWKSK